MFIGIDVSKAWLDMALRPGGEGRRIRNDEAGITELVEAGYDIRTVQELLGHKDMKTTR